MLMYPKDPKGSRYMLDLYRFRLPSTDVWGAWNPTDAERVISPYPGTAYHRTGTKFISVRKRPQKAQHGSYFSTFLEQCASDSLESCYRFFAYNCLSGLMKHQSTGVTI